MKYNTDKLDYLIETFNSHHIRAQMYDARRLEQWKENNPDMPIPSHFEDDFSLPLALADICHEIKILKEGCVWKE